MNTDKYQYLKPITTKRMMHIFLGTKLFYNLKIGFQQPAWNSHSQHTASSKLQEEDAT